MKLLPESRNRLWLLIVILVAVASGIVYLNFLRSEPVIPAAVDTLNPSAGTASRSSLLPFGSRIDTTILSQDKFHSLKSAPEAFITPEELGNLDPFAP
ncbi:MAG: hypothetical protein HY396_02010 [Candidatus Doudnabacteria bacterium]|nr:hypothetical protein [Candidatus Doudnabacteria bacterium]